MHQRPKGEKGERRWRSGTCLARTRYLIAVEPVDVEEERKVGADLRARAALVPANADPEEKGKKGGEGGNVVRFVF